MPSKLLIRVQSPDGTKRLEMSSSESLAVLYDKAFAQFSIDPSLKCKFCLYADPARKSLINCSRNTLVNDTVSHGDLIYLLPNADEPDGEASNGSRSDTIDFGEEDPVDVELSKQDGKIHRPRDDQLCHHGKQGQCVNCLPLEPYDLEYLAKRDPPIKYMSFHAYIKKLKSGIDKGRYLNLDTLDCKIKPGCKEHPAWPKGICNKCQPPTIYLNRQPYRHVDNIMFENGLIVENFLNYWRKSGHQRVGFLYGRYEAYENVPLGIRAVVSAIYEPPQITSESSVELQLPDPKEERVRRVAKMLGIKCVGWIFTDLVNEEPNKGTVKHFRGNANSFFLSSDECIMAGYFQNIYKNYTKFSSNGYFGSKFVTVVVTGDSSHQIHFEGYQVSNQCCSLVRDGCIVPTIDAPQLAYIRESTNEKYVPDVYYREKDQYNNEVTKIARPLPVEYLIIDLPAAFAKDPSFTFNHDSPLLKTQFPIENRAIIGEIQDISALKAYMKQFPQYRFLEAMSNFHLLMYLATDTNIDFYKVIEDLIDAVRTKNGVKATEWSKTEQWSTIEHYLVDEASSSFLDGWDCPVCTFYNEPNYTVCNICNSARPARR